MEPNGKLAAVTGGNRGIGFEVCRQLARKGVRVLLTARDEAAGLEAARKLNGQGLSVEHRVLDVSAPESIATFAKTLAAEKTLLDILVNNAGLALDGFDADVVERTVAVNVFGALHLTDALMPLLSPRARVVMVSSGMGSLSCLSPQRQTEFLHPDLNRERLAGLLAEFHRDVAAGQHRAQGWPESAYNVSKAAVNALTRILAAEKEASGLRINAVCPGWVRTRMGGNSGTRSAEEAADTIVWAALLEEDGPSGVFLRDRQTIPW